MKLTRTTPRKIAILTALEQHDENTYSAFGCPPYKAKDIAALIDGHLDPCAIDEPTMQSVARTLRGMAKQGLLMAVRVRQEVFNAIAGRGIDATVTAYYSARTMEQDKLKAQAWADGSAARMAAADERFFAKMAATR